jgi:translation initiation factor IF-2
MTLEQLTTKLELNILIERVLEKNGAYISPLSKEDALKGVTLSKQTKDTLHTLKSALEQINKLYDLSIMYSKELKNKDSQIYKLSVENSKLRTRANLADQRTNNITEYIELHKNKTNEKTINTGNSIGIYTQSR